MTKKPINILLVEDSSEDVHMIERILKKDGMNFRLKSVDTRDGYMRSLMNSQPQIILADHSLPQFNSIEALRILRDTQIKVPFILFTGSVSDDFATSLLRIGADGYLLKSHIEKLPSLINALIDKYDEKRV